MAGGAWMLSMSILNGRYASTTAKVQGLMPLRTHFIGSKAVSRRGGHVIFSSDRGDAANPLSPFDMVEREFQMQQKELEEFQSEMDASFSKAKESVIKQQGFRSDVKIEERRSDSDYFYSYSSTTTIGPGFEQHASQGYGFYGINLALVASFAVLSYLFHRGFESTTFQQGKKWILLPLWPVLVLFNKNFQQQFKSAIKAGVKGVKKQFQDKDDNSTNQGSPDA